MHSSPLLIQRNVENTDKFVPDLQYKYVQNCVHTRTLLNLEVYTVHTTCSIYTINSVEL